MRRCLPDFSCNLLQILTSNDHLADMPSSSTQACTSGGWREERVRLARKPRGPRANLKKNASEDDASGERVERINSDNFRLIMHSRSRARSAISKRCDIHPCSSHHCGCAHSVRLRLGAGQRHSARRFHARQLVSCKCWIFAGPPQAPSAFASGARRRRGASAALSY